MSTSITWNWIIDEITKRERNRFWSSHLKSNSSIYALFSLVVLGSIHRNILSGIETVFGLWTIKNARQI